MQSDPHYAGLSLGVSGVLPQRLRQILDGGQLQALPGFTLSLVSIDEAGRPHTVLLSLAEVIASPRPQVQSPDAICFAIWPASRAVANLACSQRGALTCVADAVFFQIQLNQVRRLPDAVGLARFVAQVERVEAQRVAYAELQSGITFAVATQAPELDARRAAQLAALRAGTEL